MKNYEIMRDVFLANGGIVRTADITARGIHARQIDSLIRNGQVARLKRGCYQWIADGDMDESKLLFWLIPDAILCMDTALFYYGYIDRTPDTWHIAINRDTNKKKLHIQYPAIKPYYIEPKYLEIGLTTGAINTHAVRIYDRERTICDVLRQVNKIDREILNQSVQAYVRDRAKNVSVLLEYGKVLRVTKKINTWIGVWL